MAAQADPLVSGLSTLPFNENQSWGVCGSGWIPYGSPQGHQYHMKWNDSVNPDTICLLTNTIWVKTGMVSVEAILM